MKKTQTRKWLSILLCLALALGLTTAAVAEQGKAALPIAKSTTLGFSSGVGAWMSEITLNPDGSVSGFYHDSDMGDTGEGYPNGTLYESAFSGQVTEINEIAPTHFRVKITFTTEQEPGTQFIEDGILHICTEPAGCTGGEFDLFLPGAAVSELNEEALSWWNDAPENASVLNVHALVNILDNSAYFGTAE